MSIIQSGASVEYYARIKAEQDRTRLQAEALGSAARKVNGKLAAFKSDGLLEIFYESDKTGEFFSNFAINATADLVKSYNKLNDISYSADRLSNEGKALLDKVKDLLTGPNSELFSNMGIELDKYTGALKFDEQKFKAALADDPATVRKVLLAEDYLGPVIQDAIDLTLSKPALSYFSSSFTIEI